jgi:hypothetical protein
MLIKTKHTSQPPPPTTHIIIMQAPSSRHVSFSKRVKVKKTLSAFDYTSEEMQATWYDSEEFEDMTSEVQRTVQMIAKGQRLDESSCHCERGIESKTPQGKDMTRSHRRKARKAVLHTQEQLRQKRVAVVDPEELAAVYAAYSSVSRYAAQVMGRSDEQAAREVNQNTDHVNHDEEAKMGSSEEPTCQRRAKMLLEQRRAVMSQRLQQMACAAA